MKHEDDEEQDRDTAHEGMLNLGVGRLVDVQALECFNNTGR
jgi:hypothetical protein